MYHLSLYFSLLVISSEIKGIKAAECDEGKFRAVEFGSLDNIKTIEKKDKELVIRQKDLFSDIIRVYYINEDAYCVSFHLILPVFELHVYLISILNQLPRIILLPFLGRNPNRR